MKAVILAGGRGRRLGHLTDARPKPMIDVLRNPLLEHLIVNAIEAGIDDYIISTGYLGHVIKEYFRDGSRFGVRIQYLKTEGKGPEQPIFDSMDYIDGDDFCCFCGDSILLPSQIKKMIESHYVKNADGTFILEDGKDSESTKRVKVVGEKIMDSGKDMEDPVLTYNMTMRTHLLYALHDLVKEREDKAFAFAMSELARDYKLLVVDIGKFVNINNQDDIATAEKSLKNFYVGGGGG